MEDNLTPEEIQEMVKLIICATTNGGEYQVENVGEHANEIASTLIYNGYRKVAKAQKARPELREEIASRIWGYPVRNILWTFEQAKEMPNWADVVALCYDDADQILALSEYPGCSRCKARIILEERESIVSRKTKGLTKGGERMKILAIDPGTHCGYASSLFESGVWNLSVGRHEGGGMRFIKLRNYLIKACEGIGLVVYEEVRGHKGTDAAQVYGGIVAIIQAHCEERGIPYQGVPVGTIKKFATGKGNSNKEVMLATARMRWAGANIEDDNQADALFLLAWAEEEYDVT